MNDPLTDNTMPDDLLAVARRQARDAHQSVRAAALLRIARVESGRDVSRATQTLHEGLTQVRQLPSPNKDYLLEEARLVAAAVEPKLLAEISLPRSGAHERFLSGQIVRVMLEHRHFEAASDYLLGYDDADAFPFSYIGNVLRQLQSEVSQNVARRLSIIRHAVDMWRKVTPTPGNHQRHKFIHVLGHFWRELPPDEALAVVREIVEQVLQEPDAATSACYPDEIRFSSSRQQVFFEMLHVLRHLDQALAQSLLDSHEQLAIAARRFPHGLETMYEEAAVEAERRRAAGATCKASYIVSGNSADLDQHRRLLQATRTGEFGPAIDDALAKYRQDTAPSNFNYAPKEFWPSTGRFRTLFYLAGKHAGSAAATLLESANGAAAHHQSAEELAKSSGVELDTATVLRELLDHIPDPDVRLFATIELAAGLAHLPEPLITQRSQPNSPEAQRQMFEA